MDRILASQYISADDLIPAAGRPASLAMDEDSNAVPVVSHAAALFEPFIRPTAAQSMLHMPEGALRSYRARVSSARRRWQRFVAIRVPPADAPAMDPLVLPEALAVIDRHYNSAAPYRVHKPTLYAVRNGAHLQLRYVDFIGARLVLRPHNIEFPVDLLEAEPGESPTSLIAGRVVLILNEP